jgi:hypothetical protein
MDYSCVVYPMDHWGVGLMKTFWRIMLILAIVLFAAWLLAPEAKAIQRCNDGTFSQTEPGTRGACSRHGGVDKSWRPSPTPAPAPAPIVTPAPEIDIPVESTTISILNTLSVAPERAYGYNRKEFRYNARVPALRQEYNGGWYDQYTGMIYYSSSDVHVDHRVPLAEVYASGGYAWNRDLKYVYANDTNNPDVLEVTGARTNMQKSGYEPHEWMPSIGQCDYLDKWVGVKQYYNLSVDPYEKEWITNYYGVYCG